MAGRPEETYQTYEQQPEAQSATPSKRVVLVFGATGQQGGAVVRQLVKEEGFEIRAFTRNPESNESQALAKLGVTLVEGDMDNKESIRKALEGVWGVFAMTTFVEGGVVKEERQGKRLAILAKKAGIQRFVFTSMAGADKHTKIPFFTSKWRIEKKIRSLEFPSYAILRPVYFMENLTCPNILKGSTLEVPLRPDVPLQMLAVEDVGRFAALMFKKADQYRAEEIDIAGDWLSMQAVADHMSHQLGRKIEFVPVHLDTIKRHDSGLYFYSFYKWLDEGGFNVEIPALESKYGIKPRTFSEWAKDNLVVPNVDEEACSSINY